MEVADYDGSGLTGWAAVVREHVRCKACGGGEGGGGRGGQRHRWGDAVVSILGVAVVGVMGRLFVSG